VKSVEPVLLCHFLPIVRRAVIRSVVSSWPEVGGFRHRTSPSVNAGDISPVQTGCDNSVDRPSLWPAPSKAWVGGRSLAGSNPAGGMDSCLLWVLCVVQVEVSATNWSLVQRSPAECGVSECDRGTLQKRARHTGAVELWKKCISSCSFETVEKFIVMKFGLKYVRQ
jgi:hypothetical protein